MKSTQYIKWDKLKDIPFSECEIKEDEDNLDIDVYHNGELVFHDYNHMGHYFKTAVELFRTIINKKASWVNLANLWTLRDCIRENYNHCLELDYMIFDERPLTKKKLFDFQREIMDVDPYATV